MSVALKRSARGEINQLPCVFAPALQQRCAVCSLCLHDEAGQSLCTQPLARATCASLHGQLRDKSRFALGLRSDPLTNALSISDELRLQCGGLAGLRSALDAEAMAVDVQRLLERIADYDLKALPWTQILRHVGKPDQAR
jgi:hypothetical protein